MIGFEDPSKLAMNSKTAASVAEATSRPSVLEPKFDGIRLLIHVSPTGFVHAYARSGKSKTGKLPAIEAELSHFLPGDTWLDAEAVAFNEDGTQDWGGAQSVLGSGVAKAASRSARIKLVVFDLLAYNGMDARSLTLRQRRELLEGIFTWNLDCVMLSPQFEPSEDTHTSLLELGYEGSMVKHLDAPYASGKRSPASLKLKATDTVDCVVVGFSPPRPGSWIEASGLIGAIEFVHYLEDGTEVQGRCSGMTMSERKLITAAGDDLVGSVIEVSYMTRMPGGKLRHPQFQRVRDDKTREECRS